MLAMDAQFLQVWTRLLGATWIGWEQTGQVVVMAGFLILRFAVLGGRFLRVVRRIAKRVL